MRPTSLNRFREQSPRPAYEANVHNVNEGDTYFVIIIRVVQFSSINFINIICIFEKLMLRVI